MLLKLILAAAVLFFLWRGFKRFKSAPPEQRKALILKILLWGVAGAILLGVITGRMHWLGAVAAGLLPFFRFGLRSAMRVLPFWLSRTGGVAPFRTKYLDIKVHIQKMQVTGTVLAGQFAGRTISDLSEEELTELEAELKDLDTKSYHLVRLIRQQRDRSQQHTNYSPPPFADPQREEALQILGLTGDPTREEIIAAHRKLINKLHPDRGGSDFLAARVNQAKDVLIKSRTG